MIVFERDDRRYALISVKLNAYGELTDQRRPTDQHDIHNAGLCSSEDAAQLVTSILRRWKALWEWLNYQHRIQDATSDTKTILEHVIEKMNELRRAT